MVVMGVRQIRHRQATSCLRFTWQIIDNAALKAAQIQYQHNQQVAMHLLACLAVPPVPDCAVLYAHNAERGGEVFRFRPTGLDTSLHLCPNRTHTAHLYAQEP